MNGFFKKWFALTASLLKIFINYFDKNGCFLNSVRMSPCMKKKQENLNLTR